MQNTLFDEQGSAIFSDCGLYRYELIRAWDEAKPTVMFIGLNPSTATAKKNDPTITRVVSFAKKHGYGRLIMTNLFGLISPNPTDLLSAKDPIGLNDYYLSLAACSSQQIVFAWGAFPQARARAGEITSLYSPALCLGQTKDGHPKHPLYLPSNTVFQPFNPR